MYPRLQSDVIHLIIDRNHRMKTNASERDQRSIGEQREGRGLMELSGSRGIQERSNHLKCK